MIHSAWLGIFATLLLISQSQRALFPSCPVDTVDPARRYICLEYNAVLKLYTELVSYDIMDVFDLPRFATPPSDWNYCNQSWNDGFQKIRCSYDYPDYPEGTAIGFDLGTLQMPGLLDPEVVKPNPFTWPSMVDLPNFEIPVDIQPPMRDIQNLLAPAKNRFGETVFRPAFGLRLRKASGFPIPTELGNYPDMTFLRMVGVGNNLLPTQLGLLTSLTEISISTLTCSEKPDLSIPTQFGQLTLLEKFSLECFGLSIFPTEILNLTRLQTLSLSNCLLTGTLPSQISGLTSLQELRLSSNALGGTINSHFFDNLLELRILEISGNDFFGTLPVPASPVLTDFIAPLNLFSGPVPNEFSFKPLTYMDIKHNDLNGTLEFLSNLTSMIQFCAQKNSFTGPIPNVSALTRLAFLDLAINRLSGTVPPSIVSSTTLQVLYLQNNLLSGTFPWTTLEGPLISAYLGSNAFDGTLPAAFFESTQMSLLDISRNKFSGPVPSKILCTLWNLDAQFNELSGPMSFSLIPDARCSATGSGYGGTQTGALRFEFNRLNISDIALDFSKPFFVFPQDVNEVRVSTLPTPPTSNPSLPDLLKFLERAPPEVLRELIKKELFGLLGLRDKMHPSRNCPIGPIFHPRDLFLNFDFFGIWTHSCFFLFSALKELIHVLNILNVSMDGIQLYPILVVVSMDMLHFQLILFPINVVSKPPPEQD
jgi:hypothetical protein